MALVLLELDLLFNLPGVYGSSDYWQTKIPINPNYDKDPKSMEYYDYNKIYLDPSYKYYDYQSVQEYHYNSDSIFSPPINPIHEVREQELNTYLNSCASLTCGKRADVFRISCGRTGVIGFCITHDPRAIWLEGTRYVDLGLAHKFLSIGDAIEIVDRATLKQFSLGLVTEIIYTENPITSIVLSGSRFSYTYHHINRIIKQTSRLHVQLLDVCTPYKIATNYSFDRLFKTSVPSKRASRNTNLVSKFGEFGTQAIL